MTPAMFPETSRSRNRTASYPRLVRFPTIGMSPAIDVPADERSKSEVTDKEITERYVGKYLPQRLRKQGLAVPVLCEPEGAFSD